MFLEVLINNKEIKSTKKLTLTRNSNLVNKDTILSNETLDIQSETINNSGKIHANNTQTIDTVSLDNSGDISAKSKIDITSKQINNNSGTIVSNNLNLNSENLNSSGDIIADTLEINNTNSITNSGYIEGNSLFTIDSKDLNNSGDIYALDNLDIKSDIFEHAGSIKVDNLLNIHNTNSFVNSGLLYSNNQGTINTGTLLNKGDIIALNTLDIDLLDSFINSNGKIQSKNINLKSKYLSNSGDISANSLEINSTNNITNQGYLGSYLSNITTKELINEDTIVADELLIKANNITNKGILSANEEINIDGNTLNNDNGDIIAQNEAYISVEDFIYNSGYLGANDLYIDTNNLTNDGLFYSKNNQQIYVLNNLINNGVIDANNIIDIYTNNLSNEFNITANKLHINSDTITNNWLMQGDDSLTIDATTLENTNNIISNDMVVDARIVNNSGNIVATNDLTISNATNINNTNLFQANNELKFYSVNLNNEKNIIGGNHLFLDISDTITNNTPTSQLVSLNTLDIDTTNLHNDNGKIIFNGNGFIDVSATLNNKKGTIQSAQNSLTLNTNHLNLEDGKIETAQDLNITTNTQSTSTSSKIYANNNLNYTLKEQGLTNDFIIESGNNLLLNINGDFISANDLLANGALTLDTNGHSITNNDFTISSLNPLYLSGTNLENNGTISGGSGVSKLDFSGDILNNSRISSQETLQVSANDIVNNGAINSGYDLQIDSNNLTNNQTLFSNNNIYLYTNNVLRNNEDANIFAMNNLVMAKNIANEKTNFIENISANIQTYNGDINVSAVSLMNKRSLDYTDDAFLSVISITDSIYFQENVSTPSKGANGLINYFFYIDSQYIDLYANNSEFKLDIDLAREPLSYHYATFEVSMDKKIEYDNPLYNKSNIKAGRNLNLNVDSIGNQLSNISAVENINIMSDKVVNSYDRNYTTNISFKTYHEKVLDYNEDLSYYFKECVEYRASTCIKAIYESPQYGKLYQNGVEKKSTGGDVLGNYDYGTYTTTQSVSMSGLIQAGGNITGYPKELINGDVSENAIIASTIKQSEDTTTTSSTQNISDQGVEKESVNTNDNKDFNIVAKDIDLNNEQINTKEDITLKTPISQLENLDNTITLPTNENGLFISDKDPNSKYLIEVNPEFTDRDNFIGSNYLLERLGYSPDEHIKFLGDGLYEQTLITDQILSQTGRAFLDPKYASNEAQFMHLMDNALIAKDELELTAGIALTSEQINSLTQDIVWMEEKIIDGQIVLAPTLYLANPNSYKVTGGAILAGDSIDLQLDNLKNSGTLQAGKNILVDASNEIKNSGAIDASDVLQLSAVNNITNTSGTMIGDSILLESSEGSIINETFSKLHKKGDKNFNYSYTTIGDKATITSRDGNTILNAKDSINNIGADIVSNNGSVGLVTKDGSINFQALKNEKSHSVTYGGGFDKAKSVSYDTGSVSANGGSIVMQSGDSITSEGTKFKSDEHISLDSQNKINLLAVANEEYKSVQTTNKKTFSSSTTTSTDYTLKNQGVEMDAGGAIVMNAKNEINMISSDLISNDGIKAISEEGDVNVYTTKDIEIHDKQTQKSKFGLSFSSKGLSFAKVTKTHDRVEDQTVNSTLIQTGGSFEVGGKDINLQAIQAEVASDILLSGENVNIVNDYNTDIQTHTKEETEAYVGFDSSKGSVSVKGALEYDKNEESTIKKNVAQSNFKTGGDFIVDAKEEFNTVSSNFDIDEDLAINAGKITVSTAKNSVQTTNKHTNGEVNVKLAFDTNLAQGLDATKDTMKMLSDGTLVDTITAPVDMVDKLFNGDNPIKGNEENINNASKAYNNYQTLSSGPSASASLTLNAHLEKEESNLLSSHAVQNTFKANNIYFSTTQGDMEFEGVDFDAKNILSFDTANNVKIKASENMTSSNFKQQTLDGSYNLITEEVQASTNQDKSNSNTITYNNSNLNANTIIFKGDDVNLEGVNSNAKLLNLDVDNLSITSLQDTISSSSNSKGVTVGTSNNGVNFKDSNENKSWTNNQTKIVAQTINANVNNKTTLNGAVLATIDENGNDNNNLKLTTKTLEVNNITDTHQANTKGLGISLSDDKNTNTSIDKTTTSLQYANLDREQITKGTLGSGNIQIKDTKNSTKLNTINRDIENSQVITKNNEVKAIGVDITIKSDELKEKEANNHWNETGKVLSSGIAETTTLLGGSEELAHTIETAGKELDKNIYANTIGTINALYQVATSDRATVDKLGNEIDKNVALSKAYLDALENNPTLATQLSNPNLTPNEKQELNQQLATIITDTLNTNKVDVKMVYTDELGKNNTQITGHANQNTAYINDKNIDNSKIMVETTAHETQHVIDTQINTKNDETYVTNFGVDVSNYVEHASEYTNDTKLADTNNHTGATTSKPSVFNDALLNTNTQEFSNVDKSKGDDSVYIYKGKVVSIDNNKNDKVIVLSEEDKKRLLKEDETSSLVDMANTLNQYLSAGDTKEVIQILSNEAQYDVTNSKIYDLNNKQDFSALQKETDMGYINNDENTRVYFANGMDNTNEQALNSAKNIENLVNQPVGSIINSTDGISGDVDEYISGYDTKDVLNEYTYRKINETTPTNEKTTIVMHSAGNSDAVKAINLGIKEGYTYPNLQFISAGSPVSESYLNSVFNSADSNLIGQVNDWKDPVTHSKTVGTAVVGIGLVGGYFGAKYMPSIIPATQALTNTGLGQFLIGVGSAGVGAGGIILYHSMDKYLQKPVLQNMIKESVFTQESKDD